MASKDDTLALNIREGQRADHPFEITRNLRCEVNEGGTWQHGVVDELADEEGYYQVFLISDSKAHKPLHKKIGELREIDGVPWDDDVRMKFVQMVKRLSEDLGEMDTEAVHALLSNEVSKIDSAFTYSDEDDVILKVLEEPKNMVDGEKLLSLSKEEYEDMVRGVMSDDGTNRAGNIVLGTPDDMRERAIVAIWTAIERIQKRHQDPEVDQAASERYDLLWKQLPRFDSGTNGLLPDGSPAKGSVPREMIDLDTRRYGVFFFAYVVNQVGIGQNDELWQLLDFLALRISTPVAVRLLNFFIDDFSKFDPDDKKVLSLCKNIVEGSEFPIATALLMAAFMQELSLLDRQNKEMYWGGEEKDLEKSIGVGNFQDYFIESASEILETVESDHLALILLECPTNLPGGDPELALSAMDIALKFDLHGFVASSRITRITGTMWTETNLLKPTTTFRVKEIPCCEYPIGLWNCWSNSKNKQGPKIWFYTPFGKFITEVMSYLLFTFFFLMLTHWRRSIYSEFDHWDIILYLCIGGFFLKEFWDMLDDWRDYFFEDTVNYVDLSIMLLFMCTVGVKMDERFEWGGMTECDETCAKFCEGASPVTPYIPFVFKPAQAFPEPLPADHYTPAEKADGTWESLPNSVYLTADGKPRHPTLTFFDKDAGEKPVRKDVKYYGSKDDGNGTQVKDDANVLTFPVYYANWGTLYAHKTTVASVDAETAFGAGPVAELLKQVQYMKTYTDLFNPGYFNGVDIFRPAKFDAYSSAAGPYFGDAGKGALRNYHQTEIGGGETCDKDHRVQSQHYELKGALIDASQVKDWNAEVEDCVDPDTTRVACTHYTVSNSEEYDQPCPNVNMFNDLDGSAFFGPEPVGWFWTGTYLRYTHWHHAPRATDGTVHPGGDADKWDSKEHGEWLDSDIEPAGVDGQECPQPAGAAAIVVEDKGMSAPVHGGPNCGQGSWLMKNMHCQEKIRTGRSLFYKVTWSTIVILMTFRLLWFLILFEDFGKFHKICLLMLPPLGIFMTFLIIIVVGFTFAIYYIAGDTAVEGFYRFGDAFWWAMNAVQGDIDYDPIVADNSWDYGDQIRVGTYTAVAAIGTKLGINDASDAGGWQNYNYGPEGPPELQNVDEARSYYLKGLMMVFLLLGCVMLINLLVAVMATIYEEIEDDAYNQIQYAKGKNAIIKDKATGMLPAPFNIVVMLSSAIWSLFDLVIILTSYYVDLQPFGLQFQQEKEKLFMQEQQTMRMSSRSGRRGASSTGSDASDTKKDASKPKNQIGSEASVEILSPERHPSSKNDTEDSQLEFSQGDHEPSYISGGNGGFEDHGEDNEPAPCCTCCNYFGCQLRRGPAQRNDDGTYETGYVARLKGAWNMVWGDGSDGWWCSYCNSFIDPRKLGENYEAGLLDIYYARYEEDANTLDGEDKLMLRNMQPKLCPACYRRRDEASRFDTLTEVVSFYSFLIILYIPFVLILGCFWFFYQAVKIAKQSKLRKTMGTKVDSNGELVMPHPRDVKADFGNAEMYHKLLKGPFSQNSIWNCAECALGMEVKFDGSNCKKSQKNDNRQTYGFDMDRTLHVFWIKDGSPLDLAGVTTGFQITDINDNPVSNMKGTEVTKMLQDCKLPIDIRFNDGKIAVQDSDVANAMDREKATQSATSDLTEGALKLIEEAVRKIVREQAMGQDKAVEIGDSNQ